MNPIGFSPPALTREQARRVDRLAAEQFGMSTLVLMENAGRGAAEAMIQRALAGRVGVVCGKGNNAGDGFVVARHLANVGAEIRIFLAAGDEFSGDAAANLDICRRMQLPIEMGFNARSGQGLDVFVDGLLGTGAKGAPRPPLAEAIRDLNRRTSPVVALDAPSGLDCETGVVHDPCVRAALTCTFVAPKVGFAAAPSAVLGEVVVVDIGVPRQAVAWAAGEAS